MGAGSWPLSDLGYGRCRSAGHSALVEHDYRKLAVPNYSTHVWNRWQWMFLQPTLGGREGTTRSHLNTSPEEVKWQMFTSPILGVGSKGGLTLNATQRTSMLELQQKTRKKIQSLCLLSLSHHGMLFLCPANMIDSTFMLSFFLPVTFTMARS